MKRLNTYKHIRKKPSLFGFSYNGLMVFGMGTIVIGLILSVAFSKSAIVLAVVSVAGLFVFCKNFSDDKYLKKILDEKFPDEINSFSLEKENPEKEKSKENKVLKKIERFLK